MKNQFTRFLPTIILLFVLPSSIALPRDSGPAMFYSNPLLLNGKSVGFDRLSTAMSGSVSLVRGNPESRDAVKVPFKVYVKRQGMVVNKNTYESKFPVTEFELREVLKYAWVGDEIVIDPVNKAESAGQRTMTVTRLQLLPTFNWLIGLVGKTGDGC